MRWDWFLIGLVVAGIGILMVAYTFNLDDACGVLEIPPEVDQATALLLRFLAKLECHSGDMLYIVLNLFGFTAMATGITYFIKSFFTIFGD